jgi:hypothetical protein
MIKQEIISAVLILMSLWSCDTNNDISYRLNKNEQYIREDGYILSCKVDRGKLGDIVVVGTYTPESWGEKFYYDYLKAEKTDTRIKIMGVRLEFVATSDSLSLQEIRKDREYIFTTRNLLDKIDKNRHLRLIVYINENNSATTLKKEYLLLRDKHSYSTGTFPHS